MAAPSLLEQLAERVERLLLRHGELQRTNALLHEQIEQLTRERDNLKSRLGAARNRIADPSIGVRGFSEQGGNEKGVGLIIAMPLGGRARAAAADRASAAW